MSEGISPILNPRFLVTCLRCHRQTLSEGAPAKSCYFCGGKVKPVAGVAPTGAPLPFDKWPKLATDAYDALEQHLMNGPSFPLGLLYQLKVAIAGRLVEHTPAGVAVPRAAQPLPGLQTLQNVIECLRADARYVDEEGEATNRLQDLLDALRASGVIAPGEGQG